MRSWSVLVRAAGLVMLALMWVSNAEAQCLISTTPVSFGSYDVLSATPRDSTGSVTFYCVLPLAVTVNLDRGANSATFTPREMSKGSGALLQYNLFMNAARTIIWGDNSAGTSHYTDNSPPILTNVTLTIYGRIPPLTDVAAGSYTDTVVATIIF